MTGTLLAQPVLRAIDASGEPMAGAQLQFYLTATTTPANVYADAGLTTPLANPVAADSGGLFAPIFLDPTVTYRGQLLTSTGALVLDIDPLSEGVIEATQAQVNAGVADGVYVAPAKLAAWTGVAGALGYTPANKAGDTLTNSLLAFTSLSTNSSGYLGLPVNEQDGAYVTTLQDAGKLVRANSGSGIAYTLPPVSSVAYPVGCAIAFRNVGAGVVTLTPGVGVSFYKAGAITTSSSIALAQGGLCTAIMEANNVWVFSGVGMT
jgi:hypothetical protein